MKTLGAIVLLAGTFLGPAVLAKELMAVSPAEFSRLACLNARLTVDSLDRELLSAAIFHETNRVRRQAGLPVLQCLEKLNEAADIQSHVGVVFRPPSHTNPFAAISTPLERVKYTGLAPQYVAENIALISIYDVGSSSAFGASRSQGKTTYIDLATGVELKAHTYASYAALVVQSWMNSPGHRKNLLDLSVKFLGCAVYPEHGEFGEEIVFSVQVFYTPQARGFLAIQKPAPSSPERWLGKRGGG